MKQYGHINFDTIHINAMLSQGYDVKIVMHKEIADKMPYNKKQYAIILPKWLGYECKFSLINRLLYMLTLIYIKIYVSFSQYDHCVISNLDELTMGLLPLTKGMYLICHGSCRGFENKIKSFFLKKLSKQNTFIVFNKEMVQPFTNNGISRVRIISHGCINTFDKSSKAQLPSFAKGYKRVVFHPSPKLDANFIKDVYNEKYNDIFKQNNILLILRNNPYKDKGLSNIKFINCHIPKEEYQALFLYSDIILFAYPRSFYLQVSGVSFECVSNQKRMLISYHPSLSYCKEFCNYDPFFKDTDEMIKKIEELISNKNLNIIATPEELIPKYHEIFKKIKKQTTIKD